MILIIDNYDSFTYNLVHIVAGVTDNYKVIRNDELSVEEIKAMNPAKILISPVRADLKMRELRSRLFVSLVLKPLYWVYAWVTRRSGTFMVRK